ncbi:MAG: peptidylprolyl isomerase, partial [[Eubacterium] siraeum]|nr:peptidylprolyl isomerase [[Eubacterium] siraeum]
MCNTFEFTDEEIENLRSITRDEQQLFPEELISAWTEHGALPTVSGIWTVFGQIIDGQEVLDQIMASDKDADTGVPAEDIRIKNIEISEYRQS